MKWTSTGRWTTEDVAGLQALAALPGSYLPWTVFAMRPAALVAVLDEVACSAPRCIVELGSGLSTVYLARLLRQRGRSEPTVVSVDDAPAWLDQVRAQLARDGLDGLVELVYAPREPWSGPDPGVRRSLVRRLRRAARPMALPDRWYARDPIRAAIGDRSVDFLLVDGPRGKRSISRYPALPELLGHLHKDATIVLDDAGRAGETEIIERWTRSTDFAFTTDRELGLAVGRRP
jgi:predicted O-methyltransferase YrrM